MCTLSAESAFYRNIRILLLEHDIMGTHLDTGQTPCARFFIYKIDPSYRMNGILRAVVGTYAALVAEVYPVVARSKKARFN